jgi:hypothetical protein
MTGWMSPRFGPIGCWGAVFFYILIVAGVFGLLYMAWSVVLRN